MASICNLLKDADAQANAPHKTHIFKERRQASSTSWQVGMKRKRLVGPENLRSYASELSTRLVETLFENFDKLRANGNIEYLHDMRVASRRLRECFSFFASLQDETRVKKALAQIKRITRAVGRSREMDVNLELLNDFSPPSNPELEAIREHFLEIFTRDQEKLRKRMDRDLKKMRLKDRKRAFQKAARAFLNERPSQLPTSTTSPVTSVVSFSEQTMSLIRTKVDALREFEGMDACSQNDQPLHRLRIQIKKLRYTMEICNPMFENRLERAITLARNLQDLLGKIHDYGVLIGRLSSQRELLEKRNRVHMLHGCQALIDILDEAKSSFYPEFKPAYTAFSEEISPWLQDARPAQPYQSKQGAEPLDASNPFIDF
jgi:CHAD domain-containing protein